MQVFGQRQLLLVAAGQHARFHLRIAGVDVEVLDCAGERVLFRCQIQPRMAVALQRHDGQVFAQTQIDVQTLALAVFTQVGQAVLHGLPWRAQVDFLAINGNTAATARAQADQRLHGFGTSGPDQSGKAEDFAGAHFKTEIGNPARHRQMFHLQQYRSICRW